MKDSAIAKGEVWHRVAEIARNVLDSLAALEKQGEEIRKQVQDSPELTDRVLAVIDDVKLEKAEKAREELLSLISKREAAPLPKEKPAKKKTSKAKRKKRDLKDLPLTAIEQAFVNIRFQDHLDPASGGEDTPKQVLYKVTAAAYAETGKKELPPVLLRMRAGYVIERIVAKFKQNPQLVFSAIRDEETRRMLKDLVGTDHEQLRALLS